MCEDQEWVEQVLSGRKDAYAHLINKYKDKVYTLLLQMTHNQQDALDITQECFIKAFHYLHSYDPSRKFSSWLYRIAINQCVDAQKKNRQRHNNVIDIEETVLHDSKSPESVYLKKEFVTELRALINRLPEKYRVVLLLRYAEELSHQEISEALDLPVNAVQVRLHRAKQKLRDHFKTTEKGGELHEMLRLP